MGTLFHRDRAEFSNRAHQAAQRLLYPQIFGVPFTNLEFEEEGTLLDIGKRGQALDGEMGIDRVAKVPAKDFLAPLIITSQERFRLPKYYHNRRDRCHDVTITEWNEKTDLPSELYKLAADLFLYGFFDEDQCDFLDAIAFWVGPVKAALIRGVLQWKREYYEAKQQTFIGLCFDDLLPYCAWWKRAPKDSGLGNILYPLTDKIRAWQDEQIKIYHVEQERKRMEAEELKKQMPPLEIVGEWNR